MPAKKKDKSVNKARKAASVEKKSAKSSLKKHKATNEEEDVNFDQILSEYAKEQERFLKITETVCGPPSRRVNATLFHNPLKPLELFLFGGELYNGTVCTFYNDLFTYNISRDEWKCISSPNTPLPRSSHQIVVHPSNKVFMFGGEFSSPKQAQFYHYNDFWVLEPSAREWTRIESPSKGSPSARSGHRMTFWKNYVLLFGGFQDLGQETKYFGDLYAFDLNSYKWSKVELPPNAQKPSERSGFSFLPSAVGVVLYGGYSKIKTQKGQYKGIVHNDTWLLTMNEDLKLVRWQRRKKLSFAPSLRVGCTMVHHKARGLLFGGVYDAEETEETLDSVFFNDLYAYQIENHKFFPLQMRKPRPKRRVVEKKEKISTEDDLARNLSALEGTDVQDTTEITAEIMQNDAVMSLEFPRERFNAAIAVADDTLFIYGGSYEKADREYTLDSMHSIDLARLEGVRCIFENLEEGLWEESGEDDDEDDEDVDESMSDDNDSQMSKDQIGADENLSNPNQHVAELEARLDLNFEEDEKRRPDNIPMPKPFETLKSFYSRTSEYWLQIAFNENASALKGKAARRDSFTMAETRWWEVREEIRLMEDEQDEAGIGDIVEGVSKMAGAGRRR